MSKTISYAIHFSDKKISTLYTHTGYTELNVNVLLKLRFQPLKSWPILWLLAPAGPHNLVDEVRTFGRRRHPVATFELINYNFITHTYKTQEQQKKIVLTIHRIYEDCRKVICIVLISTQL